ncbi:MULTISPECIES: helix-turn-helix domain-containing protein [unclassified Streptomyces]|uniref:helix-turn-helix domain-containing protein n=1 Tax=unclassified Streptomyces TaxID=2593676 RepID=UPI0035ABCDBA
MRQIRALPEEAGWSYGYVHRRPADSGVTFRPRGGDMRSSRRPHGDSPRLPR